MAPAEPRIHFDGALMAPIQAATTEALSRAALTPGNPASVHQAGQDARRLVERSSHDARRWFGASQAQAVLWLGSSFEAQLMLAVGLKTRDKTAKDGGPQVLWVCGAAAGSGPLQEAARSLGVVVHLASFDAVREGNVPAEDPQGRPWSRVVVDAAAPGCGSLLPLHEAPQLMALLRRCPFALVLGAAAPLWPELQLSLPAPDALTLGAGPIGAPPGASLLLLAQGSTVRPLSLGGGQQNGLRPGTVAKEMACGMAAALRALPDAAHYRALAPRRDALDVWARAHLDVTLCGATGRAGARLPHVTLWHVADGVDAGTALEAMQQAAWQRRVALRLCRGLCGRPGLHIGLHPGHTDADVARLRATMLGLCKADTTCARGTP